MGRRIVTKKQTKIKRTPRAPRKECHLGRLIRAKRTNEGWSVEEAAALIGMAKGGLSELENGKRTPDWLTLVKMNEGLGIPLEDLLREAAKDKNVVVKPRTDQEIVKALNERSVAFPDLQELLRRLEKADPLNYRSFLKMFDVFEQTDDPPP